MRSAPLHHHVACIALHRHPPCAAAQHRGHRLASGHSPYSSKCASIFFFLTPSLRVLLALRYELPAALVVGASRDTRGNRARAPLFLELFSPPFAFSRQTTHTNAHTTGREGPRSIYTL